MGRFRTLDKKRNKYRNHSVTIDGIRFASSGEAARYLELKDLKGNGKILDFELQPEFTLQPKFWKCCGQVVTNPVRKSKRKPVVCPVCGNPMPFERPIVYRADFRVTHPGGRQTIEDVKGSGGYTTPDFENKRKMFEYTFPHLKLEIIRRSGKGIAVLDEAVRTDVEDGGNNSNNSNRKNAGEKPPAV